MPSTPHLAIPMGDPASIGPEIVLKALAKESLRTHCQITVIGSRKILEKTYQHLKQIRSADAMIDPEQLSIVDISLEGQLEIGRGSAVTGAASFTYLQEAIAGTLTGKYQGIVTAPIAKSLWQAAGYNVRLVPCESRGLTAKI